MATIGLPHHRGDALDVDDDAVLGVERGQHRAVRRQHPRLLRQRLRVELVGRESKKSSEARATPPPAPTAGMNSPAARMPATRLVVTKAASRARTRAAAREGRAGVGMTASLRERNEQLCYRK